MRTDALACPNCGGRLETHRKETQPAGKRFVRLHWVICPVCRHVALHDWSLYDEIAPTVGARSEGRGPD